MFGHPLHPALVHFPIALLLSATAVDLAWLAGLTHDTHAGAMLIAAGLIMGLAAMGAGLADFARLDEATVPHALRHIGVVGLAWVGFAVALYLRRDNLFGQNYDLHRQHPRESRPAPPCLLSEAGSGGGRLTFGAGFASANK